MSEGLGLLGRWFWVWWVVGGGFVQDARSAGILIVDMGGSAELEIARGG